MKKEDKEHIILRWRMWKTITLIYMNRYTLV